MGFLFKTIMSNILTRFPPTVPTWSASKAWASKNGILGFKVHGKMFRWSEYLGIFSEFTLLTAFQRVNGKISQAAKMLGVTRPTSYSLVKKYNLGLRDTAS